MEKCTLMTPNSQKGTQELPLIKKLPCWYDHAIFTKHRPYLPVTVLLPTAHLPFCLTYDPCKIQLYAIPT